MDFISIAICCILVSGSTVDSWWWQKTDLNCEVSAWLNWTPCSKHCGQGKTYRTRSITQHKRNDGENCPALKQTKLCFEKPCPVDCVWGSWSSWGSCVACEGGTRSRYRKVAFPALYSGKRCVGNSFGIDYECDEAGICVSSAPKRNCSGKMFLCSNEQECIEARLKCNNDADCADASDEWNCSAFKHICSGNSYRQIPNVNIIGAGHNIIKDVSVGHVLDNSKYDGTCQTSYIGDFQTRFRRPFNLQSYRSLTHAHTTLLINSFQNTMELSETKTKEYENKVSGGVSFKYSDLISLGAKAAKSEENTWKNIIKSSTDTDYKYFTLTSKVQVGQFKMNRNNLKLTRRFQQRMEELPLVYDFARYSTFISDFGTHYYSEGSVGGIFELIFQYTRSTISEFDLTEEEQKNCLSVEASASFYGIEPTLESKKCTISGESGEKRRKFSTTSTKTVSSVRGGSSKSAALLTLLGNNTKHDKYLEWVDSIKHNPSILDFKISPISNLLSPDKVRLNTERALADLFRQYDPKKCSHGYCRNNGVFVMSDYGKQCTCLCPSHFYGVACNLIDDNTKKF